MIDLTEREELAATLCAIQNPYDPKQAWAPTATEFRADARALLASPWMAKHDAEVATKALERAKSVVRGEGEPGHSGELVAVNFVDELIDDLITDIREQETS